MTRTCSLKNRSHSLSKPNKGKQTLERLNLRHCASLCHFISILRKNKQSGTFMPNACPDSCQVTQITTEIPQIFFIPHTLYTAGNHVTQQQQR